MSLLQVQTKLSLNAKQRSKTQHSHTFITKQISGYLKSFHLLDPETDFAGPWLPYGQLDNWHVDNLVI